ncbi:transcriptional regulator, TraR/DksA family [Flavimobilis marinus]|uniref:Transcriptional regulator, TraR/DksA family n=1 Tax=Flavimobilis marinus TaxID=285351 RepID=A0A1I2DIS5_9MICO|nr:TraR/DksA C4-type zinc finger protein [Flavimobilis marinus]SFE79830.1 transcriptional regulator, TraR/DksA family [Flavimobilis marinus]
MSREDQEHPDRTVEGNHPAVAALVSARAEVAERLRALRGGFDEIVAASADSNADDEHDPEGATIAFERAQVDALARQAQSQLEEIHDAFARVAAGTYGRCEACGRQIPAERLAVRPTARRCVACASGARRA